MSERLPDTVCSVAAQWTEAWRLPMYRIPEPAFDDTVIARFDDPASEQHLRMAAGSSASILSVALMVALRGEDDARVQRIAERVPGTAQRIDSALRSGAGGFADAGLEAPMRLALAARVAAPAEGEPRFRPPVPADVGGQGRARSRASKRTCRSWASTACARYCSSMLGVRRPANRFARVLRSVFMV